MKVPSILIFNFFTTSSLKQIKSVSILNRRLKTIVSDLNFTLGIFAPLFLLIMIPNMLQTFSYSKNMEFINMNIIFLIAIIPFSVITFMIINKDFYNGRSIGKRVFGYQVVDIKTNSVASEIQCMARNLTLLIWPLEILIVLINPSRRLGDIIAGTKVIEKEQVAPESILVEINEFKNGRNNSKVIVISIICTTLIEALSILPLLLTN